MTKTHTITKETPLDAKIMVSKDGTIWNPRYLSTVSLGMNEGEINVKAWYGGKTSFTAQEIMNSFARQEEWAYAETYEYFLEEKEKEEVAVKEKWITDRNPSLDDICDNGCSFFITACRYESYAQRCFFNVKTQKWYEDPNSEEEIDVKAWMPLPKYNYNKIILGKE